MKIRILPLVILTGLSLIIVKVSGIIPEINLSYEDNKNGNIISNFQLLADEVQNDEGSDENNDKDEKKLSIKKEEITSSPGYKNTLQDFKKDSLSEVDRKLLNSLAKRREELNEWESSIYLKENLLATTEKRIEDKLLELKNLKAQVESSLEKYDVKERKKIQRLVKIYESMKSKDAANIFKDMDIEILLEVVSNMKEAKVANILANLDPIKAKNITVRLAERNRLPSGDM